MSVSEQYAAKLGELNDELERENADLRAEIERLKVACRDQAGRLILMHVELSDENDLLKDEIERLTNERDQWKQAAGVEAGLRREFLAGCERLRAALQQYGDHTYECELKEPNGSCTCGYERALEPKT